MEEHTISSPTGQQLYRYNAIGEGQILVTDSGGNIEAGDYICSSDRLGHGMLQDDDILHNYTVAKATETVDFSNIDVDPDYGFKSTQISWKIKSNPTLMLLDDALISKNLNPSPNTNI